jgi:hypothetical protein
MRIGLSPGERAYSGRTAARTGTNHRLNDHKTDEELKAEAERGVQKAMEVERLRAIEKRLARSIQHPA